MIYKHAQWSAKAESDEEKGAFYQQRRATTRSVCVNGPLLYNHQLLSRRGCAASAVYTVVVCPSVISWYCVETTGRIELGFGVQASFHLSHTVFKEIRVPLELCSKLLT